MAGIDSNTIWMCHCDGADASTTFTDSSSNAFTATAVGNAQIDTAQSKFGGASGLFDGTGDRVHIGDTALLDVGTGDFTVDMWVRFNATGGLYGFCEWGDYATAGFLCQLSGTTFQIYVNNVNRNYTWSPSTATWYHLAIERYSANIYIYVDGTKLAAAQASTENISGSTGGATFGDSHTLADRAFNGWIDEVRWSNVGRYAGTNFTPETTAYSSASSVKHLALLGVG